MKPNDKVYDDAGTQIAEFDLEITGKLGSAPLKWLIECRDRPSQGPAPGAWIEQLDGRRRRFKFDKVTAVSTTGFAAGAEAFASQCGIDLRTVSALTPEAICSWCKIRSLNLTVNRGELFHAVLYIDDTSSQATDAELVKQIVEMQKSPLNLDVPFLINTANGTKHCFRDAWQAVMNNVPDLFKGLEPNAEPRKRLVQASYTNQAGRYELRANGESVPIIRIDFHAKISVVNKDIPVFKITEYVRTLGEESIAHSVRFIFDSEDAAIWEVSLHKFQESGNIVATSQNISD